MNDRQAISIAVLTTNQDDVELINGTLRDGGHAAHCHWVRQPEAFDALLARDPVELVIVHCERYPDTIRQVIRQKDAYAPEVHVIAVSQSIDEAAIDKALHQGACDLVSITKRSRLQAVVDRELRAFRVEQALNSTLQSATGYRKQLDDYMQGSASAIAYVQEGIITELNRAWLALFRGKDKDELQGLPLMDHFEAESQAAIKGA
ncbi:MAG: hypothetical protein ACREQZ_12985, partial [Woeseiaceae bacterium]